MSLELGRYDGGSAIGKLFSEYWRQIGLMLLVFSASFGITMIATSEPTIKIVIRHGIKDGVQFTERWCRRYSIWGATETPEITRADGSKSC